MKWYDLKEVEPSEGKKVALFLMDGTIINVEWCSEIDEISYTTREFLKGRYPRFWCDVQIEEKKKDDDPR